MKWGCTWRNPIKALKTACTETFVETDAVSSCTSSAWSIRVGVKNAREKKQPTNQTLKQQEEAAAFQLELQT